MIFKLIATACVALGLAGIMLLLSNLSRGLIPRWTILAAAAAGIFGYPIFEEYNWHSRKIAGLENAPGNFVVVGEYKGDVLWKPWTYVFPPTVRVDAVNTDKNQPVAGQTGVFENFIGISRSSGHASQAMFVFDCQNTRFAPKSDNPQWGAMMPQMIDALCK